MKTRSTFPVILVAGGLAFGMAACEADDAGTSPGIEEPAIDDGAGTDPLAPTTDDTGLGEG